MLLEAGRRDLKDLCSRFNKALETISAGAV